MRITINYQSSWRNIFIDGDNDSKPPKGGRKFIASFKNLNPTTKDAKSTYKDASVEKNTVMGILNRLIGDSRKLYQSRESEDYYFKDIEKLISFEDQVSSKSEEIVYLRNFNNSEDKHLFLGMMDGDRPAFTTEHGQKVWSLLTYSFDEIVDFILNDTEVTAAGMSPSSVIECLSENISTQKPIKLMKVDDSTKERLQLVIGKVLSELPESSIAIKEDTLSPLTLYCDALYIQVKRLSEKGYDFSNILTKLNRLSGVNPKGITVKNFLGTYSTGGMKVSYGSPFIYTERVKGEGKFDRKLNKCDGKIVIDIDVDKDKAIEIRTLIENAAVSSFYVGKKGLAYVSKIRI